LWTAIYISKCKKGGHAIGKNKLNIRFHNLNTDEETLKHIAKIFIDASRVKFENILQETALKADSAISMNESPAS